MVRGSHAGGGFPKSEIFQAKCCTIAMAGEQERQEPGETGAYDGGAGCEAGGGAGERFCTCSASAGRMPCSVIGSGRTGPAAATW